MQYLLSVVKTLHMRRAKALPSSRFRRGITDPIPQCHLPRASPGNRISITSGDHFKNTPLTRIETQVVSHKSRHAIS